MKINKKKLLCCMIDAGLNNRQLSEFSGVSIARISNIRNGNNTTYETASKIAKVLKISVQDLIEDENNDLIREECKHGNI